MSKAVKLKISRNTRQRGCIMRILKQKKAPISAMEILKLAQARISDLNKTTVYRTLERLVKEGLVESVNLKSGLVHFELADQKHHHHHFLCDACTKIFCLEGCAAGLKGLLPQGFLMTGHDLTIRGICSKCR